MQVAAEQERLRAMCLGGGEGDDRATPMRVGHGGLEPRERVVLVRRRQDDRGEDVRPG
jgi:hypothetical protein